MIVSAEVPEELVIEIDRHIAKERLRVAETKTKAETPMGPSRSSFIKDAIRHYFACAKTR